MQLDSLATIVQRDVAILAMEKIVTFIVTVQENFVTQQMVVGFQVISLSSLSMTLSLSISLFLSLSLSLFIFL